MFTSVHTAAMTMRQVQKRPVLSRISLALSEMASAHRQRAQLRALDDASLADIGLTRAAALAEAERPIWDVPASWRRPRTH